MAIRMEVARKVQVCRMTNSLDVLKVQKELKLKQDARAHHTRAQKTTRRLATTNAQAPQRHQSSL